MRYALLDNLILCDPQTHYDELLKFKAAGRRTVVDATSVGTGRNPDVLRRIAETTELNIVAAPVNTYELLAGRLRCVHLRRQLRQRILFLERGT